MESLAETTSRYGASSSAVTTPPLEAMYCPICISNQGITSLLLYYGHLKKERRERDRKKERKKTLTTNR